MTPPNNEGSTSSLPVVDVWDLPIREASGLALRQVGHTTQLIGVGDSEASIIAVDITHGRPQSVSAIDMGDVARAKKAGSQFEAVAVDRDDRVAVLQESPPAVLFVDAATGVLAEQVSLDADEHHPSGWYGQRDGRGEGLVFGDLGLLVGKEKRPAGLLQFVATSGVGTFGSSPSPFTAAGWWEIDDIDDVSDVTIGPDGRIYVLSDQSRCIARLRTLREGDDHVDVDATWAVDAKNMEGLVVLDDMTPLVAVDTKKGKNNLLVLGALTDT
jgi:hypothetical protein